MSKVIVTIGALEYDLLDKVDRRRLINNSHVKDARKLLRKALATIDARENARQRTTVPPS
jgi:hypothetical protein